MLCFVWAPKMEGFSCIHSPAVLRPLLGVRLDQPYSWTTIALKLLTSRETNRLLLVSNSISHASS